MSVEEFNKEDKRESDNNSKESDNDGSKKIDEKIDTLKAKCDEKIDKLKAKCDSLWALSISKEERDKKLEEIEEEAKKMKEELVQKADTLKKEAKEWFQARLDTLNNLINFRASIGDGGTSATDGEKGFFGKIGEWFGNQRKGFTSKEEWENATWKNGLRAVGGLGLIGGTAWSLSKIFGDNIDYAAVIEGYKGMNDEQKTDAIKKYYSDNIEGYEDMDNSEKRKARRKLRKELKKAERERKRAERKDKFWKSGFGTFLKSLGVLSLLGGGGYLLKKGIDKGKEKSIEKNIGDLRGFEASCKKLKDRADECLKEANHIAIEESVKRDFDKILEDAVILQNNASKVSDEISKSKASNEIKVEAVHLMEAIDDYVDEIRVIKDKIYETDPFHYDPSKPETTPESDVLKPVNSVVLTKAAIDYLNDVEKNAKEDLSDEDKASLERKWDSARKDIEKILTDYFNNNQILKKNKKSKEMVLQIDDATAFSSMIKNVFDKLPDLLKNKIPEDLRNGMDDIAKTLEEADAKTYEDIIFKYLGSFVANAVKSENGTMTVQTYYDGISKVFPNKNNASQIESDLAESGQADNDIKDMTYPFVVSVND